MGYPYTMGSSAPIVVSATTNATAIDCLNDPYPRIILSLNADTLVTLTRLASGARGILIIKPNPVLLDRTFALANSDNPNYFQKRETFIDFYFDGTKVLTQSSARMSQKSFGANLNSLSANLTLYLEDNGVGEFLNAQMFGSVSVANNSSNYWQMTINDTSNTQQNILMDTKFFTTANTRFTSNGMAATGRRQTNVGTYRCNLTRVGSPGNLSIHSLGIVDFIS